MFKRSLEDKHGLCRYKADIRPDAMGISIKNYERVISIDTSGRMLAISSQTVIKYAEKGD